MNSKLVRHTIKLIREYFRLQADGRFLAAILEMAVQENQPPFGWLEALKQARQTLAYQSISEQYASQLAQLEESADASELDQFLSTIPPTQPLN